MSRERPAADRSAAKSLSLLTRIFGGSAKRNEFVLHNAVKHGRLKDAEALLADPSIDPDLLDPNGFAAIHYIFTSKDSLLIQSATIPSSPTSPQKSLTARPTTSDTAMLAKQLRADMLELFIQHSKIPVTKKNERGEKYEAPRVDLNVFIHHPDALYDGMAPIHLAAKLGRHFLLNKLLGQDSVIQQLNIRTKVKENTALQVAAYNQQSGIVNILQGQGDDIDINARNKDNFSALHLAVMNLDEAAVRSLSNHLKLDETIRNEAAQLAYEGGNDAMARSIQPQFVFPQNPGRRNTMLHIVVRHKQYEIISNLLNRTDIDINAKDSENQTALHIGVGNQDRKAIDILMANNNINIYEVNGRDQTAAELARSIGRSGLAKLIQPTSGEEVSVSLAPPPSHLRQTSSGDTSQPPPPYNINTMPTLRESRNDDGEEKSYSASVRRGSPSPSGNREHLRSRSTSRVSDRDGDEKESPKPPSIHLG